MSALSILVISVLEVLVRSGIIEASVVLVRLLWCVIVIRILLIVAVSWHAFLLLVLVSIIFAVTAVRL